MDPNEGFEFIWCNISKVSALHFSVHDVPGADKIAHPLANIRVYVVIIRPSFHCAACASLAAFAMISDKMGSRVASLSSTVSSAKSRNGMRSIWSGCVG